VTLQILLAASLNVRVRSEDLIYACTRAGVQAFDPTGRLCGVILAPTKEEMTAICIGQDKGNTLYVACGDRIYARPIQGKAVYTLKKEKGPKILRLPRSARLPRVFWFSA
jgi:hypothetical protein